MNETTNALLKYLNNISGLRVTLKKLEGRNYFEFYGPGGNVVRSFFDYHKAKAFALGVAYGCGSVPPNDLKFVVEQSLARSWKRLWLRKWETIAYSKTERGAKDLALNMGDDYVPYTFRVRRIRFQPGKFV